MCYPQFSGQTYSEVYTFLPEMKFLPFPSSWDCAAEANPSLLSSQMPFGMPKSFHESAGNLIDVLVVAAELTAEVILPEQHVNPIFYY